MTEPWVEKYRPKKLSQVQGNNKTIKEVKEWAENWEVGDTPILFYGPPGLGKTTIAHCLANEMGWDVVDVNASSERTRDDLKRVATQIRTSHVNDKRQLLVLDEIDSWPGRKDLNPIIDELKEPSNPVICIGNDDWKIPKSVKDNCKTYQFKQNKSSISALVRKIAEKEKLNINPQDVGRLATRGNFRAAIMDLQRYGDSTEIGWDDRNNDIGNFDAMDNLLRGRAYLGELTPPEAVLWAAENLPSDLRGVELGVSMDALSRADKWLGRCGDNNYRWWKYAGELARTTAKLRITKPWDGYIKKEYPQYYKSSTSNPNSESDPEAILFRTLKGKGNFEFAGDFLYFRTAMLPTIKKLGDEEKYSLAVEYGFENDRKLTNLLGINKADFKEWFESSGNYEDASSSLDDW